MTSRRTALIALAGFGAWLVFAVITWATSAPLGHDESQYALSTRDVLAGEESRWFYLSRGMHAVAAPGIWLGGSEHALRFVPVLIGIGFMGVIWVFARRIVGPVSAAWALVVIAGSRGVVRWSADLLSDIPSAACLIAALAIIIDEVDRDAGPRWRLIAAAPVLAAAVYCRYGSVVPIAVIAVASVAVGARTLVRRPLPVIATAVVFLVLLVPHFAYAQRVLGSPLGILLASRAVPQQEYLAEGLVTYLTSNPFRLYGTLTPIVMLAGVTALRIREHRRLLAWLVGVGSFVAMGLTTHAMPRYILVSIAILIVLGTDRLRTWIEANPPRLRRALSIAAVAALAVAWLVIVRKQHRAADRRRHGMRGTLGAAEVIRADAAAARCMVIGTHFTQLEWYSGCRAPLLMDGYAISTALARGERVYVVRDHTPSWSPVPQPVFAEVPGVVRVLLEREGEVEVGRVDPPAK